MFRFRLARVLRYRERRVHQESRALRLATETWRSAQRARARLEADLVKVAEEGERQRQTGCDVAQWRLLASWLTAQEERLRMLRLRERDAALALAAQRRRLLQVHRDKEILERLRERQQQQHDEEERRRDRRRLDELGGRPAGEAGLPGRP